jgi:outer membrane protein OmpU
MREKMKKILLASTALVATAGIASAEVSISGMAEMGIFNSDSASINVVTSTTTVSSVTVTLTSAVATETDGDTQFFTDIDVTFKMSGETDGGISFGATVDLDENAAFAPATQGGETIFVSYGGATLTMGDTDGAFDAAMPEVLMAGGSINDDEENAGYNGNSGFDGKGDGQVARFDYAFDAFTLSLSAEQMDDGASDDNIIGVGVKYSGDFNGIAITAGLGYQTGENMTFAPANVTLNGAAISNVSDAEIIGVGVTAGFANGFSAGINYSSTDYDLSGLENTTHVGLGLGYEANALAVGFNYGKYENVAGQEDLDASGFGLAVAYDLGGGLTAKAGYGSSTLDADGEEAKYDSFSLGLGMSF